MAEYIKRERFLSIVPIGLCPKCLHKVPFDSCIDGDFHFHCINPKCPDYQKDLEVPYEIFNLISYLMDHQPYIEKTYSGS